MLSAAIDPGTTTFAARPPVTLFEGPYLTSFNGHNYDVFPDGQHFLMIKELPTPASPTTGAAAFVVVTNWFDELKRIAPARKK